MYRTLLGIAIGLCLLGISWGQGPPRRMIVDTDAGSDDLLAILFLLERRDVHLEAITVVNGLARVEQGVETIRRLLRARGHEEVPVYRGAAAPLEGAAAFPAAWRVAASELLRRNTAPPRRPLPAEGAAEYLRRRLLYGPPVDVLALGPLTNFGQALRDEPRLGPGVRQLTWMGGAIRVPGNVEAAPTAEWNAFIDPLAVEAVLGARWRLRIVPLDATSQVPISLRQLEEMEALRLTPAMWLAVELLRPEAATLAAGQYFAWDPLAAVAMVEPRVLKTEHLALAVRRRRNQRGRLLTVDGMAPNAEVATGADPALFRRLFTGALLR